MLQDALKAQDQVTQKSLTSMWEDRVKSGPAPAAPTAQTSPSKLTSKELGQNSAKKQQVTRSVLGVKNTLELLKNRIARESKDDKEVRLLQNMSRSNCNFCLKIPLLTFGISKAVISKA